MDIYTLLKNDHDDLKEVLTELIALDKDDNYREVLIEKIKKSLIPHSRAEESVFYNSIRAVGSDQVGVMHSYKEHMEAEAMLRGLQMKNSTNMDWKSTAIKLKEALEHHIAEEEDKIFTAAKKIFTDAEAKMMGEAFVKLKSQVEKEGFLATSFEMVKNLMPPRFGQKVKGFDSSRDTTL